MLTYISKLLAQITMYQAVLYFLRGLIITAVIFSFLGLLPYTWWHILANLALLIAFCLGFNNLFAKLFKTTPNYESQYITAEILTLIVGPLNPFTGWWVLLLVSFFAMASKYILAVKKRHIFNPAAIGVLASALLVEQGASWWIGGKYMMPFIVIGGLAVVLKLRWLHMLWSFLFAYVASLIISLTLQGMDNSTIFSVMQSLFISSSLVFFATVMLVEPATSPRTRTWRIIYGAAVAVFIIALQYLWPNYGYSIETGLLLGNLVAFIFNPKTERQTLQLVEKTQEAKDTYSFWFEPYKKFNYTAGQFLEWTLAHPKNDSRGIRRFFTISSSPTEKRIRLITRFYENPSTFKQTLMKMNLGDEIIVSGLEGEFVLPKSEGHKYVFIAGGVGIAPFLSMMKEMVDKNIKRDIVLFYANKTSDDIAFKDLTAQAEKLGVKTVHVLNNPPPDWKGQTGFITPEMIQKEVPDWKDRIYYVSGPEPMVMNYEQMLAKMGIPDKQAIRDYFPGYQA